MSHWRAISRSRFPWEEEAIAFLQSQIPENSRIYGWSNFEFVADEGSIYEVDALVVGPWGAYLIEIKSRPGAISGGGNTWRWTSDGKTTSDDNPLLLANRKAKSLIALLGRQKAFNKVKPPFLEALVFLSHESNKIQLTGNNAFRVANRAGIRKALTARECPGLKSFSVPPISKHQLQAFHRAMEQAGIRELCGSRKAGDYVLESLFWDCPTGAYQDWIGKHERVEAGERLIRTYALHRQSSDEDRAILERAAEREYQILSRLDHPGILRIETMTSSDSGPAVVYRFGKGVRRLDHYLEETREQLGLSERLELLRQIAEAVAYAHRKKVTHRALSPQSVLVFPGNEDSAMARIKIYNWQAGVQDTSGSHRSRTTRLSRTIHASQLLEDASTVYLAPELVSGQSFDGIELDMFSLGAIAYRLLTNEDPAGNTLEVNRKLQVSGGYLDVRSVMGSVDDSIVELVQFSANVDRELRDDADAFLKRIDVVEDALTAPADMEAVDPRRARPGDPIGHGFTVKHLLGSGGISKVLEVAGASGGSLVLKVASEAGHSRRIRKEFETLEKLSHPGIIKVYQLYEFRDLTGFTMEKAGESTLAQRLRKEGTLSIDYLERFGKELLKIIDYLDQNGIYHRDIKPENIGIGSVGKGMVRLILFDFSLSQSPPDQLHVGTPPYLDPFLETRPHRRWDSYAERFSAAMTLYEMATGSPATFGDGKSVPYLTGAEANIEPELFPENLRKGMAGFFANALDSDYSRRHDNAEEMLRAWSELFSEADKPAMPVTTGHSKEHERSLDELIGDATLETQLLLLGLSTRLANSLDRLGIVTVHDLLKYPLIKIHRQRGVGKKTREEAAELVHKLRKHFPDCRAEKELISQAAADDTGSELASVDEIVKRIMALDSKRRESRDQEILRGYLGLGRQQEQAFPDWSSQADYAREVGVTRARIGQIVTDARKRWQKVPALNSLRDSIAALLQSHGGVMTRRDLIRSVLNLRGSALQEPERSRTASMAVRAAIEGEHGLTHPRFSEFRRKDHLFVALDPAYVEYACKLGEAADRLTGEDPLPTASRSLEKLQEIPFPDVGQIDPPPYSYLLQLGAAASDGAAVSPRLELYPRNLSAERALKLAQNNLYGSNELSVAGIRQRVLSRYPESEPLPDRPELDSMLQGINFRLQWSPERNAYVVQSAGPTLLSSGLSSLMRTQTRYESDRREQPDEEEAEAQRLQEKLEYAARKGSFLVLTVEARYLPRAESELEHRFDLRRLSGDRLFIDAMKQQAAALGVDWEVVLQADAAPLNSRDWDRLQMLVERSLPQVKAAMEEAGQTILLTHPGLFARYQRLNMLDTLRNQVGTPSGPHGLWILIPGGDSGGKPSLGKDVIPMVNPAQFEALNRAWLENKVIRKAGKKR